jgi:hypothetical protein
MYLDESVGKNIKRSGSKKSEVSRGCGQPIDGRVNTPVSRIGHWCANPLLQCLNLNTSR